MPQMKRIVIIGRGKGIILPKHWLDLQRQRFGQSIAHVMLTDGDGSVLLVPVAPMPKAPETTQK